MGILDYQFSEDPEKDKSIRRGLLDFGLSMLSQGGKPTSQAIGNSGLLALQQSGQRESMSQRAALHKAQLGEYQAQAESRAAQAQKLKADAEQEAAFRKMLGGAQQAQGTQDGVSPTKLTDWPNVGQQSQQAPALDFQALARAYPQYIDKIKAIAEAGNIGRPEVARTLEEATGNGKQTVQLDKYGQRVGSPVPGYIAPQLVNLGDRQTFMTPQAGVSMRPGMSPSERDASARGWSGQQQADRHFKATQEAPQYMQTDEGIVALPKTLQAPYAPRGTLVSDAGGNPLGKQAGKAPPGYRVKPDGSMEAVPGGPADIKAGLEGDRRQRAKDAADAQAESVLGSVKEARALVGHTTAGIGGLASVVPATTARDLQAKLTTIKANLGFDRLQEMRLASPTGGALGQVAVQELTALQATVASLDQYQSPGELKAALDKIEKHYNRWQETIGNAKKVGGGGPGNSEQDERAELEALRNRFKR